MNVKSWFYWGFVPVFLAAELPWVDDVRVSSAHASYEGRVLQLEGDVHIEHAMGIVTAQKALLEKSATLPEDAPFSYACVEKDVRIALQAGAILSCQKAELHLHDNTGSFFAGSDPFVVYKNGEEVEVCARRIDWQLALDKLQVESISAQEGVQFFYKKLFSLQAPRASYHQGVWQAFVQGEGEECVFSHAACVLKGAHVWFDQQEEKITVEHPKGQLQGSLLQVAEEAKVHFRAGSLVWKMQEGLIRLQKEVFIEETGMGSLATHDVVECKQDKAGKGILWLEVPLESILSYQDMILVCPGLLRLDGEKGQVVAHSTPQKLLKLYNNSVMVDAEYAQLEYQGTLLSALSVRGKVRFLEKGTEGPSRAGLCDKLFYMPDTRTIILLAAPGKKVLFQDSQQSMVLSAQEVHITQNLQTGKFEAKGVGSVKLSFSAEEHTIWQETFPLLGESHE